jgi:hypothetical protein
VLPAFPCGFGTVYEGQLLLEVFFEESLGPSEMNGPSISARASTACSAEDFIWMAVACKLYSLFSAAYAAANPRPCCSTSIQIIYTNKFTICNTAL